MPVRCPHSWRENSFTAGNADSGCNTAPPRAPRDKCLFLFWTLSNRRPAPQVIGPGINFQIDGARPSIPGPPAHRGAALLLYLLGR
jgi:hypothetical protein